MKIATWSGPRNLSTAMMYSFGNRSDFEAMDEPFYAAYLAQTGTNHPMRDEIIAYHETDPAKVAKVCAAEPATCRYMKHMPHHMCDGFPMHWADGCVNIHLLRHPARVLASYAQKRETVSLEDIGFPQQLDIFDRLGGIVIDSSDIRANPDAALRALCAEIGLSFDPAMLNWPAGPRSFDGVWAQHWYGAVHRSTGFAGSEGPLPDLPDNLQPILAQAMPIYRALVDRVTRLGAK